MKHHILSILSVLLLSACSLVNEPVRNCTPEDDGEEITLTFKMTSSSLATRADDKHEEEESEYRELEDGIDYNDLGIFVFVKMATQSEEKLLMKSIPGQISDGVNVYLDGAPGAYNVSITIMRTKLHELLFGEGTDKRLNPDDTERVQFRTLIVANSNSPGTNPTAKWNKITGTTFSEVIEQFNEWHYAIAYLYNNEYPGNDVAGLYRNKKKNIPMFGTNVFYASQSELYYSRPEKQVFLGEVDMLRALAKVRVVDNIKNKDASGYPKIAKAEFLGTQTEAKPLPDNAIDYKNGNQVHIPNIVLPDIDLGVVPIAQRLGVMPESMTTVPQDQREGSVFVGFVPEQKIGYANNDVNQGMPIFRITVEFYDHSTKDYEVNMKNFNGQTFDFGDNILRNHIYTLSVNEVEPLGAELKLNLDVVDWTELNLTLDYTETVAVEDFQWEPGTYESFDPDTGTLVLNPWYAGKAVPLVGKFKIISPVGAFWNASLIGNGVILFDEGYYQTNRITGYIGNTSDEGDDPLPGVSDDQYRYFNIISTIENPEQDYSAVLQLTVTLPNGKVMEVPLTPEDKSYKNFTIVQYGN